MDYIMKFQKKILIRQDNQDLEIECVMLWNQNQALQLGQMNHKDS